MAVRDFKWPYDFSYGHKSLFISRGSSRISDGGRIIRPLASCPLALASHHRATSPANLSILFAIGNILDMSRDNETYIVITRHVLGRRFMCSGFGVVGTEHENALAQSSYFVILFGYLFEAGHFKTSGDSEIGEIKKACM